MPETTAAETKQEKSKEAEQPLKWSAGIATQDPFHFTQFLT